MSRLWSMVIGLNLLACTANAQWMYPRGYSGYGMSRWGSDPAAGYMAGLGVVRPRSGRLSARQGACGFNQRRYDDQVEQSAPRARLLSEKKSGKKRSSKKPSSRRGLSR